MVVGGGRVSAPGAVHMVATLAGYRTALVGTGRAISAQTGSGTTPLPCRGTIFGLVGSIQSGGALAGW